MIAGHHLERGRERQRRLIGEQVAGPPLCPSLRLYRAVCLQCRLRADLRQRRVEVEPLTVEADPVGADVVNPGGPSRRQLEIARDCPEGPNLNKVFAAVGGDIGARPVSAGFEPRRCHQPLIDASDLWAVTHVVDQSLIDTEVIQDHGFSKSAVPDLAQQWLRYRIGPRRKPVLLQLFRAHSREVDQLGRHRHRKAMKALFQLLDDNRWNGARYALSGVYGAHCHSPFGHST